MLPKYLTVKAFILAAFNAQGISAYQNLDGIPR